MSLGNGQQHYPGSSLGLQRLGLRASAFLGYTRCTLALQAATATVPLTADTGERDKSSIQAQSGNLLWDKGGTGWQGWKWGRRRCASCLEECLGITHTHTHTHTHAHTRTHARTRTHALTHARAHTRTHAHKEPPARPPAVPTALAGPAAPYPEASPPHGRRAG